MLNALRTAVCAFGLLFAATCGAMATPISLTFSGQFAPYAVYDGSQQFGPNSFGNIAVATNYTIKLTFDPAQLTGNSCPVNSVNTSCQWNFGASGITEAITINGITKSFTSTSGNIQYCTNCGGNYIAINANTAGGGYFGGNFADTNKFFSSQTNANNANLLIDFTNVAITGNYGSSTSAGGNLSFNTSPTILSSTVAAVAVPEPLTLSIFGAGFAGATMLRRRKAMQKT